MAIEPAPSRANRRTRRWLQLSLRSFLLLLTLFCIWLALAANRASQQRKAIAILMRGGGGYVRYHHEVDAGGRTVPWAEPLAPAWLRRLVGEEYFRSVYDVGMSNASDNDFACLRAFGSLRGLNVSGLELTDAGLAHLKQLRRLEQLTLLGSPITDDGLAHLPPLLQLKGLGLGLSAVTGDGLAHLARQPALESVGLDFTAVGDRGLERLAAVPTLRDVRVRGTGVRSAGRHQLRGRLPGVRVSR